METFYIDGLQFIEFIKRLAGEYDVFSSVESNRGYTYKKQSQSELNGILFNEYRPEEPLKSFFTCAVERVTGTPINARNKETLIWGVKSCDLQSLKIQDFVFKEGEFKDPFYIQKRENTFILSSDCTACKDCCFCLILGVKPYPEEGFDLNFSPVSKGYVVTVGSEKGRKLIAKNKVYFKKVTPDILERKYKTRDAMMSSVNKQLSERFKMTIDKAHYDSIKANMDSYDWDSDVTFCVECGACNLVCPTCHCFLLSEQKKTPLERFRKWDACLYASFAKVAGGANPRKYRAERLKNRFEKKFVFFPEVLDLYACTGCGRCITACPAKIDIRDVIKVLSGQAQVKEKAKND